MGLMELYFKEHGLVTQHLDSYNLFVEKGIQRIVNEVGIVNTNVEGFQLKFGDVRIERPMVVEADGSRRKIMPMEARIRNLTYASPIFMEIIPVFNGVERRTYSEVFIGELPVMVKSKLCYLDSMTESELIEAGEDPYDPGGYFIINGSEKVLVGIEDLAPNRIMVTKESADKTTVAKVFSTRNGFRARCAFELKRDGSLMVDFPGLPREVNLMVLLKALGFNSDQEIIDGFSDHYLIRNTVLFNLEMCEPKDTAEALEYLGKRVAPGQPETYRENRLNMLLDTYLLPHIGTTSEHRKSKAWYLIEMAEKTIFVEHGVLPPDDKDHYANKRIKLSGTLMEELFRYAFQFLVKDMVYQASRAEARGRRLVVQNLVRPDAFTDRIRYAMATGNWIAGQTGVSQLLDRLSFLSSMSHLRRVISPLSKRHPHFKARDLHGTHWGKLCPNESPEGPSCGLVKNLALLANITVGEEEESVETTLRSLGVKF